MKKRRILSLIVAMVMVMSSCLVAVAATDPATITTGTVSGISDVVTNTETVTITGTSDADASSFSLTTYQVIYATYVAGSNSLEYHLTEWAKDALVDYTATGWTPLYASEEAAIAAIQSLTDLTNTTVTRSGDGTTAEQNEIVNALAAYVALGSAVTANYEQATTYNASWDTTTVAGQASAELPVGAYLVLPSASNMSFLNMLVSVDATEGSTANTWKTTGNGAVLKGKPNGIEKLVSEGGSTAADSADAQIGEAVTYTVTVDVPQFATGIDNSEITFKVVDDPDDILIITGTDYAGITVKALTGTATGDQILTKDTDYTVGVGTNGVLTVDLSTNYQTLFCASGTYPYTQVEITYSATVLSTADVDTANTNTATLTYGLYSNTPNTKTAQANVYTYEVVLTKIGEDASTVLPGTEFQIATGDPGTAITFVYTTGTTGTYTVYDGTSTLGVGEETTQTLVAGVNGTIAIIGLDSATEYIITETKAPSGYSRNSNYFRFTINATTPGTINDTDGVTYGEYTTASGGTALSTSAWTAAKDGNNAYQLDLTLADTKIAAMPSTGSIGIIIFTVLGVCLMIVAVFLMTSSKDSKKKQAQ